MKENINKTNNKIKYTLSGKIPRIKTKNIFKDYKHSSSLKNIKIKNTENYINKTNIKEKKDNKVINYTKTLFRFNSSDYKDMRDKDLYSERCTYIRDNLENNQLGLSQKISLNSLHGIKNNENKNNKINNIKNNNNKKIIETPKKLKNTIIKKTNTKHLLNSKKNNKFKSKNNNNKNNKNNEANINSKKLIKINKKKDFNESQNINTDRIIDNKINKTNNNNNVNNYYIPNIEKNESINNSSIFNIHLNDQKFIDNYELCWNVKNDYSKDIDISLISVNNQKKSIIKNYKLSPNIFSDNFNDNNNINNIYLNNIQNVNDMGGNQNDLSNINNKQKYISKLELLENENKILKDEIKESKNRISLLEYKIEELLDDKGSKDISESPQPTPYVIKYSKNIFPPRIKPKIEENNQEQIYKTSNEILKEYSKNETKESDMSNRITNKNEEELKVENEDKKYNS